MSIEKLAAAIGEEFSAIHTRMDGFATKEDLEKIKCEIFHDISGTLGKIFAAINALDARFSTYAAVTDGRIGRLDTAVHKLDGRVKILEGRQE